MEAFWAWFQQNESWIIKTLKTNGSAVVWAIDERLSPAFARRGVEIQFQLGFNNGQGEFSFLHLGKSGLERDGKLLGQRMPRGLHSRWTFILEP